MHLEIVTPDSTIFDGEITMIKVPGTSGSFAVLHNHAPIISTLEKGEVKLVEENGKEIFIDIDSGIIEVRDNNIIVLVEKIPQGQV